MDKRMFVMAEDKPRLIFTHGVWMCSGIKKPIFSRTPRLIVQYGLTPVEAYGKWTSTYDQWPMIQQPMIQLPRIQP